MSLSVVIDSGGLYCYMDKLLNSSKIATPLFKDQFRLYNHVFDSETQLTIASSEAHTKILKLKKQGLPSEFLGALARKIAYMWDKSSEPEVLTMLSEYLCTFGWVVGRLPKINDFSDVLAVADYITRVHFGKPCMTFLLSMSFGMDAQSLDWSVLKTLVSGYATLKTHPAVIKFIKVISLAFSGGILESLGVEAKTSDLWSVVESCMTKIIGHTDFFAAILDLINFIGERISAYVLTGDWKTLIHTPTNYSRWADRCFDLMDLKVGLANPEALGMDYHSYTSELSQLITQGEEIKRYLRGADEKDAVSQTLSKIRVLYNEIIITQACGKFRPAPFGIMVYSGTGAAKSTFVDMLLTHYGLRYNKPLGDEFIYTRTAAEPHWNNFKTSMWGCILDDIGSINPNKGTSDPSSSDLLQVKNNVSFSPPQAALDDKGKTPFRCDIVVATTNTKDLMAHCWYNNPQALRRRLPYVVTVVPKLEYRSAQTNMADQTKIPVTLEGHYPDLWDIVVEKVTVDLQEKVNLVEIMRTSNVYEFILQYNVWLDEHRLSQAAFMASKDAIRTVKLCSSCEIPDSVCPCPAPLVPQGVEEATPQGDDDVICASTVAKGVLGASVAYATYKALGFSGGCAANVVHREPLIVNDPIRLARETMREVREQSRKFVDKRVKKLVILTRDYVKGALKRAILDIYLNFSPYLHKLMAILLVLSGAHMTYKFLRKEFPTILGLDVQVDIDEVGVLPTVSNEKENVWRKDDYVPSEFLGRLAQSWSSLTMTKAASLLSRNVVWCQTTHSETKHIRFRALCVAGHLYVVPSHVLPQNEYFMLQVIHENTTEGCNGNITFKMAQRCIYRRDELELAFFEINHMPVRRNLLEMLPKRGFICDGPGRMIIRNPNGSVDYMDTKRTFVAPLKAVPQFNIVADIAVSTTTRDTVNGECGSPVIVQQPNACVLAGIHVLGGEELQAVAMPVFRDVVDDAITHFCTPTVETDIPFLTPQFSTTISQRCTTRFFKEGTVQVYGSFGGFKPQPKSSACDTLFTRILLERGFTRKYGPAPMKGYMPLHLGLKPMLQKTMTFKEDVLRKCSDSFTNTVWDDLPTRFRDELKHPIPLKVALNGFPGTKFIDSMNFGTSAGYPHNTSKRNFITRVPADDIWQHPIVVDDKIKWEISECWDKMRQGVSVGPIFMQHLKDEALPMRKVIAGKARIFMGGPFAWSTCVRMVLLPFVRVMQWNKYLFECAPGTNATSIEWRRLYTYLTRFGDNNLIAGDFETFDKLMGALVILEAFRMIRSWHQKAGAHQETLNAIQVIAEDVAFAFVNFNGDLMRFFGSNPSGHPLTVIINCLVNSLYMRYCYFELNPEHEVDSFKKFVALITYGDDNAIGSGVPWFNHTSIAEILATVGVRYTMAEKTAISVPFINISEVSFLKRKFRWEPELDAHMAILDEDSIWKSLMIFVPSSTDSPQKQCLDIVRSAVSEWFFYGRERYAQEVKFLQTLVSDADLSCYVERGTFPLWDELAERFIVSSNEYLSSEPSTTKKILGDVKWKFKCDCDIHVLDCPDHKFESLQ